MKTKFVIVLCLLVGVIVPSGRLFAQDLPGTVPEELPPEAEVLSELVLPEELTIEQRLRQRGSFRFADEDIRTVMRSLARAHDFNITLAPEIEGRVTVDFTNVEVLNALDTILRDHGFGYIITGDIVRVTTLDKIRLEEEAERFRKEQEAQRALEEAARAKADAERAAAEVAAEPLEVRVFRLRYIDAEDAKNAIEPLITPGRGKATVLKTRQFTGFTWELAQRARPAEAVQFERSTTLIVQDTATSLRGIESALEKLDRKPRQILIDAKIVEIPIDQRYRLGVNWTRALDGWVVGADQLQMIMEKGYQRERLFMDDVRGEVGSEFEDQIIRRRDEVSTRGDISSRIWGEELGVISDSYSFGDFDRSLRQDGEGTYRDSFRMAIAESGFSQLQDSRVFQNYVHTVADTLTRMATTGESYSAILSAAPFNLMLSAMKTDSNITFLSNPRVIVQENYAAQIHIGEKYPILRAETSEQGVGGFSVDYWQDIGITLKVIPQVRESRDGTKAINMIIHPVVSVEKEKIFAGVGGIGTSYPVLSLREADTNVTINDGDTIVIGGLIQSDTVERISKIPLLGDIPLLGYLFKERYSSLEKKNILLFITARIVDDTPLSLYERMMLEKAPPEALRDVRRVPDDELRPFRYLGFEEMPLPVETGTEEEEFDANPGPYYLYDRERDASGGEAEDPGRRGVSRARERSLRR